jgi:hypothetical protein
MATNGIQWLRNVRDGISTPAEALAEMESNHARISALSAVSATPGGESEVEDLREEIEALRFDYAALANNTMYDGNSIGWIASKAKNYGRSLMDAWDAVCEIGGKCDGNTPLHEAIRKQLKVATPAPAESLEAVRVELVELVKFVSGITTNAEAAKKCLGFIVRRGEQIAATLRAVSGGREKTKRERLEDEHWRMMNAFGGSPLHDGAVQKRIDEIDAELATLTTPAAPALPDGWVPPEAVPVSKDGLAFGVLKEGDWAIPTPHGARIVDARMAYGWNQCREEMKERLAAAPQRDEGNCNG